MASPIKVILGIGNPGKEFAGTYHNAGLLGLAACAARDKADMFKKPPRKHFDHARGEHFVFARSLTFMNESGKSAAEVSSFFKISPQTLLVMHDESDLPLGTFQCSFGKGAAGHRGISSIQNSLGTHNFWRLRIGIRPLEEPKQRKAGEFVLKEIRAEDWASLERTFGAIADFLVPKSSP